MGKFVFLKELYGVKRKAPVFAGAFFNSGSILAEWEKLIRQL
jgi:hypothetical protein